MKKIPVIGIGASAGGLKEFEHFFKHMPAGKEVAFVLIQHLAPDHKSILADIVKRYTEMDVFQVEDKVKVEAGKVYIIPPNNLLTIAKGKLLLSPMQKDHGRYLPIDFFFRSLKDSLGEEAIAVILSGTGSDGTLGIKEVKEAGGLTIVQQPETADYDGMPTNAIKTGLIDFIIPVEDMPDTILSYIENKLKGNKTIKLVDAKEVSYFNQIFNLIKQQKRHDFTNYKRNTILRRIERRLTVNKFDDLKDYIDLLKANPKEIDTLYKELLISVTSFFRDAETFKFVEKNLIPKIVAQAENQTVRIWVPACATGEEAYSWAMLFKAYVNDNKLNHEIQIFASDIDAEAVERAREGYYTNNIVADVPRELLERFFIKEKEGYKVKNSIRESVIFADQNLLQDPPYSRLDMVSCRNVLIYLDNELQQKAISILHYALKPNCTLVLGNSESLGNSAQYFKVVDRKFKIFTKIDNTDITGRVWKMNYQRLENQIPAKKAVTEPITALTKEFILDRYTPPSVVIDYDGEMVYIQGKTGKYLELSTGEVKNNIVKVAREGLKVPLLNAIRKVKTKNEEIIHKNIRVKTNGDFEFVNLCISPFKKNNKDTGLLIVIFEPTIANTQISGDNMDSNAEHVTILELEKELAEKEQYLQNTIEELETTNEELKSSNEEAQSTNEELKSTNEELETSKEELQSVNEELSTSNNELILKIDELAKVNNNLKNLLDATNIATIFLDRNMKIFNFTPSVSEIIDLLHTDIGRSIQQFTNNLNYDNLIEDTKQVLKTLIPKEKEVYLANKNYFWMRIIPYLTIENVIEGVVITFTNITEKKKQEAELEKYSNHLEELVEEKSKKIKESEALLYETEKTAKIGGWQFDPITLKQTWTDEVFRILEIDLKHGVPEVPQGLGFIDPEFRPMAEKAVQRAMELGEPYNQEWMATTAKGNKKWVNSLCNPKMKDGKVVSISGSFQDITSKKLIEEELKKNREILSYTEKLGKVGGWEVNIDTMETTWTEEVYNIHEVEIKSNLNVKKGISFYTPESRPLIEKAVQNVIEFGDPFDLELEIITAKGNRRNVHTIGKADLEHRRVFGFFQDITLRKQIEEKIQKKDQEFRKLSANVPDLIFQFTRRPDGTYYVPIASEGIKNIFGCSPEDVTDNFEPIARVIHPEDAARVIRDIEYSATHLTYFTCEFRVQIPDRGTQWIFSKSTPEKLDDGSITWYGFNVNITERKKFEQELVKAKERAEENERKLIEAQELSHIGSWEYIVDTDTVIWSKELYNIFERSLDLPAPKYSLQQSFYTEESFAILDKAIQDCVQREIPYEIELDIIVSSGSIKQIISKGNVIKDENNKIIGSYGTAQDITQKKKIEQELIKAKEKAEESDRLKSAFLANMSHEIRTPMNGILGFTSLLQEPNLTGEEQQQYIEIIQKSGDRMLNTVNDIIDISKIESGLVELSVSEVNIYQQLKYLHSFFKPEAANNETQLLFKNDTSEPDFSLKTDFEKFNSIVTNLVKNAIKFTRQGTIELGYNIKKEKRSSEVEFYVKDTGIGISKARQRAIFERFVQADIEDKRALQGSGLGLAISKAYVKMLGGKIWLKSVEGMGSTFYFTLPYNAEPKENEVVEKVNSMQNEKNQINPEISGLKILIAEDDETSEELIKITVDRFAKEILIARNGFDAVEYCRKNPDIDLVLMDIQLPDLDGYNATKQIRRFNKEVIIIAQTAYALSGDREKAIAAGCNYYISKPVTKDELLLLIQKYFKK